MLEKINFLKILGGRQKRKENWKNTRDAEV